MSAPTDIPKPSNKRKCRHCNAVLSLKIPPATGQAMPHCQYPGCTWCLPCVRAKQEESKRNA